MIISPLTFKQVNDEFVRGAAIKLGKPALGEAPEALDAVYVAFAPRKFFLGVKKR